MMTAYWSPVTGHASSGHGHVSRLSLFDRLPCPHKPRPMKARSARARVAETRSTRDVILDAAERRFAERGFAGVSVREIASDAGLKNQASLYHHFKNKKALYEAVLERGLAPIIELVSGSQTAGDASDPVLD